MGRNIWFCIPQNIKSVTINFKIDKEWLEKNNIDEGSIKLMRYSNMWNDLPTRQIESTDKEIHYQADTQGFTFFAITGETGTTSQPSAGIAGQDKPEVKNTRVQTIAEETQVQTIAKDSPAKSPGFEMFFAGVCLLLVYSMRKMK